MPSMTEDELSEFLDRPLTTSFTTVRPDGSLHVTPIWYEYAEGRFYCMMGSDTIKARNIIRNPHVALCIASHDEPYKYVVAEGLAEVTRDGVDEKVFSISVCYRGEERGSKFAKDILDQGRSVLVVVSPTRLLTESVT